MAEKSLGTPFSKEDAKTLQAGDMVLLSGTVYTARDAAHARLVALLQEEKALPFPLEDAVIFYVGPTPTKPGEVIGSAGPTTSYRMDAYTPELLSAGLRGMIGKGQRSVQVLNSMKENSAVYFGALGGAGALLSSCIKSCRVLCYEDLGPEAIHELQVVDFPLMVAVDCTGNSLYEIGPKAYLESCHGEA